MKIGKRIMMPIYLDPQQREAMKRLAAATRVPMSVYFREAVDDLLAKYSKELKRKEGKR